MWQGRPAYADGRGSACCAHSAALALGLTIIHRFTQATIIDDARIAAEVAREVQALIDGALRERKGVFR